MRRPPWIPACAGMTSIMVALATLASPLAAAAGDEEVIVRPAFALLPSTTQLQAAKKFGKDLMDKAEKAGRPALPHVAMEGSTTLISLESVAICDRDNGCPLLVFRDITQKPVLVTASFQNVAIIYRGAKTFLVLKSVGPDRECLLPPAGSRAKCAVVKKAR